MTKSQGPTLAQLIDVIESRIPTPCSESWDSVGLVVGEKKMKVSGIVVAVDLTPSVLATAKQTKCNVVILHHPPLFPRGKGLTKLTTGQPAQALPTLLLEAFQKKIAIYVAHTNFDRCALDGMIQLASDLGAEAIGRLWEEPDTQRGETLFKKLVVMIPAEHFTRVRDALYAVGCGHIGQYDSCGFAAAGLGNYRPLQGAKPFQGKVGDLETADEIRFETLVVSGMEQVVIETLLDAHPYEEVAYDLYPVLQSPSKLGLVWGLGYGFVAQFKTPIPFATLVSRVKKVFESDTILTNTVQPKKINKIAFSPGKGTSFLKSAQAQGVEVYLTGEVGYHGSLDAARSGMSVFELGHRESEHYFLKTVASWCKEWGIKHSLLDERTQRYL